VRVILGMVNVSLILCYGLLMDSVRIVLIINFPNKYVTYRGGQYTFIIRSFRVMIDGQDVSLKVYVCVDRDVLGVCWEVVNVSYSNIIFNRIRSSTHRVVWCDRVIYG